jgi:hypothetical protein
MVLANLKDRAVPTINDRLTNARICGAKILQSKDVNSFAHLEPLQPAYGAFHKIMNFVWMILKVHRGTIDHIRSLKYFFALLKKTRLGNEKADYHTLVSVLMQILYGLLLNAWLTECGFPTFTAFAELQPSPKHLLELAVQILNKYATPMDKHEKAPQQSGTNTNINDDVEAFDSDKSGSSSDHSETESSSNDSNTDSQDPQADRAHQNIHLLTQDLLYVAELLHAVSDGDYGCIEDILGNMAMMFWGGGSNNYCTELLHFIFNLKMVWGDDFV